MAKPHKLADGRYECQNCLKKFTKNEWTFKDPIFHSDKCRKEFHANSGMSLKKLETRVRGWVRDEIQTHNEETAPVNGNHGIPEPVRGRVSPKEKARAMK